jgi:hypothetical protein
MVRGPVSMVVVGVISLATIALVVGGPRAFEGVLPEAAIAVLENPGALGGMQQTVVSGSGEFPADYLQDSSDGLVARGPIAAGPGNAPVFIKDVITGHTTRVGADIPAEITTIRPILGCRLTPPLDGTGVGHVAAGASGLSTALATYNDTDLAAEVQVFVDVYRKTGAPNPFVRNAPAYEAYDVAVTETRAPVYLVLENRRGNRLWNIHLAEGARIERVVLLGGGQAGVANLDPVVPVEVILGDGLDACGIRPAYPLNEGHLFFQSLASGATDQQEAETKLAAILEAVASYDTWFRDSFGVTSSESRIGFDEGTISVIGPIPGESEPKAVYAPISGAKIRMTQDAFFEIAGQVAEGGDFADRVKAIATSFAFGDLKTLQQGVDF